MKVVIQRVTRCSVSVNEEIISSIGKGIFVLVGIARDDGEKDINYMTKKILNLRLFDDNNKRWSKSVVDKDLEVLCVSQFTLCHKLKGDKLDFHHAMAAEQSKSFYNKFLDQLKLSYKPEKIKDGQFGAYMSVELCNDGPVTVELSSNAETQIDQSKEHLGACVGNVEHSGKAQAE